MSRLTNYDNPSSFGSRLRRRRIKPLMELISATFLDKGVVSVLDLGGRRNYWSLFPDGFLEKNNVFVTIANRGGEKPDIIDDRFVFVEADACDMADFKDGEFDVVHSNSVIEHVGNWNDMRRFAGEAQRLGKSLFIQTPYYWFPVEPHFICPFIHWLPWPMRVSLHMRFKLGSRRKASTIREAVEIVEGAPVLLDKRMFRELFPDCEIIWERFFLFRKSMIAYRN